MDQFGKLTATQIEEVLDFAREIRKDMGDVQAEWSNSTSAARISSAGPITWAVFYELPFLHHVIAMLLLMGFEQKLKAALTSKDPHAALLEFGRSAFDPGTFDHLEGLTDQEHAALMSFVLASGFAMRSMETYSLPMHRLVALAGQGDREAFRRAVTIDPTSVAAPSMLRLLSQAVISRDRKFLREYRSALKGPHKALEPYADLRVVHLILEEAKAFSEPREKIFGLIVS